MGTTEVACATSVKSQSTAKNRANRLPRTIEGGKEDDIVEEEDEEEGSQQNQHNGKSDDDMASVAIEGFEMCSDGSSDTSIKRMEGSFSKANDPKRKSRGSLSV